MYLLFFILYVFRATGHIGNTCNLAQPRRKSCDLTLGLSIRAGEINGGHQDAVSALVMYKDTLISGSWDKTIKIWSTETWACLQTISNYASIRGLCICSDNLISCAEDGVVNVWQFVEDESHLGEFSGWELLHSLAGSESGTGVNVVIECEGRLACGVDDGTISLWNTDTWTKDLTIRHIGIDENDELNEEIEVGVMCLAVHDGKLVSSGDDSTIRIWCTRTWTCEHVLHTGEVWSISFTPLGNMVVGSVDDYLAVWHQVVETPTRSQTHVYRPDMNVNSNSHNTTRNVKTEWKLNQKVAGQKPVYATCYFNGCIISAGQGAADDHDNTISCWKARRQYGNPAAIETLELLCDFGIGEEDVWSLAVCDGKLVSGEANGCIRIWA